MEYNPICVSIIIPIYNSQDFLDYTLNSIANQSYQNIEIILVNDGSSDDSEKICKKWVKIDNRVKYITQPNLGVSAARAKGVSLASGDWIMFCDSDDLLASDAIDSLLGKDDCDIIVGKIQCFKNEVKHKKNKISISCNDNISFMRQILSNSISLISSPCAKLYRRDLFNKNDFSIPPDIVRGEDFIMNFHYAINAKKICYVHKDVYFYRQHNASAIHTFRKTWEYEKKFLSVLLTPLYNKKEFDLLREDILRCVIRSIGNAYQDKNLIYKNKDFVLIKRRAHELQLGLFEYMTLNIVYLPTSLRYFIFRIMSKFMFYVNILKNRF